MLHVTIQCLRSLLVMRELYSYTGGSHSVGLNFHVDIFVFFFYHIFFCLVLVFLFSFSITFFPFGCFPLFSLLTIFSLRSFSGNIFLVIMIRMTLICHLIQLMYNYKKNEHRWVKYITSFTSSLGMEFGP